MEYKPPTARPPKHPRYDAIHRALLSGLLTNIGTKSETHEYQGARGMKFSVFPGSGLFGQKVKWIMAGELVETTKLYARTCAGIQPQWIERTAAHLVERSYSDPRWDAATGSVIATEKVTLYGLVLIPARNVPYGPIDARNARAIFIHHALVLGDLRMPPYDTPFFRHNAALVTEVEQLEAKIRQRNLLADAATRYTFYEARVPQEVTNAAQFESWRKRAEGADPRILYMKKEDLLRADAPAITPENYPDKLSDVTGGLQLPVDYRFAPGEIIDGLTLTVPVAALAQLRPERYEWMVRGMLEEKIALLLRELPGALRRNFVPVPEWAKSATAALMASHVADADVSLRDALADYLARQTGVEIKGADFQEAGLPAHMRMNYKVLDDAGKILGLSRDLPMLQRKLAKESAGTFATIYDRRFNREQVTAWDFGDLPESVTVQRFKMTIVAYPALVDVTKESGGIEQCALRLLPPKEMAEAAHRAGVRRLFRMEHRRELKMLVNALPEFGRMALQYYSLGAGAAAGGAGASSERLREELTTLVVDRALFADVTPPRTREAWLAVAAAGAGRLTPTAERVGAVVAEILAQYHALTLAMEEARGKPGGGGAALSDVREQLAYLVTGEFLLTIPWEWLEQVPRYLAAMRLRLEKLTTRGNSPGGGGGDLVERDFAGMGAVAPWWNLYVERRERHGALGIVDPELALFRWMVEEYRVSVFAQELGVRVPVSEKRLEKQWERVRRV